MCGISECMEINQFCHESQTALKSKVYFLKKNLQKILVLSIQSSKEQRTMIEVLRMKKSVVL